MTTTQSINENSNNSGIVESVWIFSMGDDEEEIAMWNDALVNSIPPPPPPARGPGSIYSEQEVEQYVKTSVSSALERARQRHSARQEERKRLSSSSSSLSPSALRGSNGDRKSLSPKLERRVKVRQSMISTIMPTLMDV